MTDKEAIEILENLVVPTMEQGQALSMALNALEQQSCEKVSPRNNLARTSQDCISREELLKLLDSKTVDTNPDHFNFKDKKDYERWVLHNGYNTGLVQARIYVRELPSVTSSYNSEVDLAKKYIEDHKNETCENCRFYLKNISFCERKQDTHHASYGCIKWIKRGDSDEQR